MEKCKIWKEIYERNVDRWTGNMSVGQLLDSCSSELERLACVAGMLNQGTLDSWIRNGYANDSKVHLLALSKVGNFSEQVKNLAIEALALWEQAEGLHPALQAAADKAIQKLDSKYRRIAKKWHQEFESYLKKNLATA